MCVSTAEKRWPALTCQLISIHMASSLPLDIREIFPSTWFLNLMKVSTSVGSLDLENQHRAGWLSEVSDKLIHLFKNQACLQKLKMDNVYLLSN